MSKATDKRTGQSSYFLVNFALNKRAQPAQPDFAPLAASLLDVAALGVVKSLAPPLHGLYLAVVSELHSPQKTSPLHYPLFARPNPSNKIPLRSPVFAVEARAG